MSFTTQSDPSFVRKDRDNEITIHVSPARVKGVPPSVTQTDRVHSLWLSVHQFSTKFAHWFGLHPWLQLFCKGLCDRMGHVRHSTDQSETGTIVFIPFRRIERIFARSDRPNRSRSRGENALTHGQTYRHTSTGRQTSFPATHQKKSSSKSTQF